MSIGASLDVSAKQCLDALVAIIGDLLKLIYSYKTWFVCLVEIRENLIGVILINIFSAAKLQHFRNYHKMIIKK